MKPEEQEEFAEIICDSFTEDEIEHLEQFAEWCFEQVDKGNPVKFPDDHPLILDQLKLHNERGEDDE